MTYYGGIPVVIVLLIGDEIDLAQELLLVMLEFAHHDCDGYVICDFLPQRNLRL